MSHEDNNSSVAEIDKLLAKLRCTACGEIVFVQESMEGVSDDAVEFKCKKCGRRIYLSNGVLDCLPDGDRQKRVWESYYSSSDQSALISALENGLEKPNLLHAHYSILRLLEHLSLPLSSSIELGSGSGAFSLILKRLGIVEHVTLLDYSEKALLTAKKLFDHFGESCTLVKASIDSMPFRDNAFELSLSAGVIEHYPTPQERMNCFLVHTAVARKAFVQAPVSSPCYWMSRTIYTAINRGWPFGFERPVTMREMRSFARETRVRIIGCDHQYFLSWPLFTRLHWLVRPGWYTWPFQNEISILVSK